MIVAQGKWVCRLTDYPSAEMYRGEGSGADKGSSIFSGRVVEIVAEYSFTLSPPACRKWQAGGEGGM